MKMTLTSPTHVCCRELSAALAGRAGEGAGETLVFGVDEDGALFFKLGHTAGGQFTSAFGERLAYCPFCGRGVVSAEAATRLLPRLEEAGEETARWSLGESQEIETVIAQLAARASAAQIHVSEF